MRVLAVNTGSATLKCGVFDVQGEHVAEIARVRVEVGTADIREAVHRAIADLDGVASSVDAVGHRVVHGGRELVEPVVLDEVSERTIEALSILAPLHNPVSLAAIRVVRERLPGVPMVGVFDTAFHSRRPEASMRYAVPRELAESEGLLRYGFHGIAHGSLVESLARVERVPESEVHAVTLQLGQGCSACAVAGGRSVETSMGFTPLEGLPMGTRSGDIDPGLVLHLLRKGWSPAELEDLLVHRSGLLGLAGSSDMRTVLEAAASGARDALLARDLFVRRVVLAVGGYLTLLGGRGSVVFGGGIGEGSPEVRRRVCELLGSWGVTLDAAANEGIREGRISTVDSRPVYVLCTDEERAIAREAAELLGRCPAAGHPEV